MSVRGAAKQVYTTVEQNVKEKMKKIAVVLLGILLVSFIIFSGCKKKTVKIGVAVPPVAPGWTGGIGWWADYKVNELQNKYPYIQFNVVHSGRAAKQTADVEELAAWGMDYLVIFPLQVTPLTEQLKKLAADGVRIIVVDRGIAADDFGYVNITGDHAGLGRVSGEWLAKTMTAEGLTHYVAMGGMPSDADAKRMNAFFTEMEKEPSLVNLLYTDQEPEQIADCCVVKGKYEFANWSRENGLLLMQSFLYQFPQIDAVFCQDDDVLTGVLQAIKEADRTGIKIVMGGSGSRPVYQMIMNGDPLVRATALYHPSLVADGIQYAVDVANGKKSARFARAKQPLTKIIPSVLIDKSNVERYYNPDSVF